MNQTMRHILALGVLLIISLVPLLGRVPRAYVDDSWSQSMAAYTIAFEGVPRNPGQMGRGGVDSVLLEPRLFGSLIGAAVYRIAGFGLTQGRVAAALFCGVFIFAVYGVMRWMFVPTAAFVIAGLTAVDPWTFLAGRTFREEIFLSALLWTSAWLLLESQARRGRMLSVAGGVCAGLACWAHANAVVYLIAAVAAVIATIGIRRVWSARPLWVLLGFAAGLAPYVAFVLYEQGATGVLLLDQVGRRTGAYARPLPEIISMELDRWADFLRLPMRAPLAALYAWGLLWTVIRGGRVERGLALWIALSGLLLPLWASVGTGRYLVVVVPALAAMVWRSLPRAAGDAPDAWGRAGPVLTPHRAASIATVALLLVYAAMSVALNAYVMYAHRNADYDRWMARIAAHVPAGARVMGHTMFWTGLHDRKFVSAICPRFTPWRGEWDACDHIRQYRPDRLIQSSHLFSSVGGTAPKPRDLRATLVGRACETIAASVPSEILLEFYDPDFGAVRVWKLDWPVDTEPTLNESTE